MSSHLQERLQQQRTEAKTSVTANCFSRQQTGALKMDLSPLAERTLIVTFGGFKPNQLQLSWSFKSVTHSKHN